MKQFLYSLWILTAVLLASCNDQIQAPTSSSPERIVYSTMDNSQSSYIPSVHSVNSDGTGSIQIAGQGKLCAVSTSKILWNESNDRSMPNFKIANNDGSNSRVIDIVLSSGETISEKNGYALSPDGSKICYATIRPGDSLYRLFVMNVDGTNKKEINDHYNQGIGPAFSPDGSRIAYYAAKHTGYPSPGTMEIANIDGSNATKIADISDAAVDDGINILWSSRNRIAYFDHYKIYISGPDGSNQHLAGYGIATGWSADGSKLTYSSDPANIGDPTFFDVYYTEDEGITSVNVTNTTNYNEVDGVWSADGKSMIVTRWQGDFDNATPEIIKIDVSSLAITPIASAAGFGYFVKQ
jgi:Tol biopolymer transport system component